MKQTKWIIKELLNLKVIKTSNGGAVENHSHSNPIIIALVEWKGGALRLKHYFNNESTNMHNITLVPLHMHQHLMEIKVTGNHPRGFLWSHTHS
jgi:hypothetical protein